MTYPIGVQNLGPGALRGRIDAARAVAVVALLLGLGAAAPLSADPQVSNLELVSSERVDRTTFAYTYRIVVDNDLPGLNATVASVTSGNPATVIVDDEVMLGTLPVGTLTSTDTFTLHQDRTVAFDPGALEWTFTADIRVTISGQVRDAAIGDAAVILSVEGTGLSSFGTTADGDGFYTRSVEGTGLNDFVSIEATGVGEQSFVLLSGYVGSMSTLLDRAAAGGRSADPAVDEVDVTHITTALRVLAEQVAGGPIADQATLDAASAAVDTGQLIVLATIIKTVVDNTNIDLPPGITDTLALAMSPGVSAFGDFLATTFPDEYNAALDATIMELGDGFVASELPPLSFLTIAGSVNVVSSGVHVIEIEPDSVGSILHFAGESSVVWIINAAGELVLDLSTPLFLREETDFDDLTGAPIRVFVFLDEVTLVRFARESAFDRVHELSLVRRTFPDNPELPDELVMTVADQTTARLLFKPDAILPFTTDELLAGPWALRYFHRDNDTANFGLEPELGFDLLQFDSDGTGATNRRGFGFDWTIDGQGILELVFDNGDVNHAVRLVNEETGVYSGVLISQAPEADARAHRIYAIERDPDAAFAAANISDKRYRAAWVGPPFSADLPIFDYVFGADSLACRNPGSVLAPDWSWSLAADRVEILRRTGPAFVDSFGPWLVYRTWQPVRANGARYWVVATRQANSSGDDPFIDPAVTPGTVNAYDLEQNLDGNVVPVANEDFLSAVPGTARNIAPGELLDNDSDTEDDELRIVDFDRRTAEGGSVAGIPSPASGRVAAYQYLPPSKYIGPDSFGYAASDSFCEPRLRNDFEIAVDPASTYFTVEPGDPAGDAMAIDLGALGFSAGDVIRLNVLGAFQDDSVFGLSRFMTAVFSSSDELGPPGDAARVVGAIDAGEDFFTDADIPQDFGVDYDELVITIPEGAQYLFVAGLDIESPPAWGNNTDSDGDYGIGISAARASRATVNVDVFFPDLRPVGDPAILPGPGRIVPGPGRIVPGR